MGSRKFSARYPVRSTFLRSFFDKCCDTTFFEFLSRYVIVYFFFLSLPFYLRISFISSAFLSISLSIYLSLFFYYSIYFNPSSFFPFLLFSVSFFLHLLPHLLHSFLSFTMYLKVHPVRIDE